MTVELGQLFPRALDQPSRRLPQRANQTTSSTWQTWMATESAPWVKVRLALGQAAVPSRCRPRSPGGAGAGGQYLLGLCLTAH
jgi:hypothetical protein